MLIQSVLLISHYHVFWFQRLKDKSGFQLNASRQYHLAVYQWASIEKNTFEKYYYATPDDEKTLECIL